MRPRSLYSWITNLCVVAALVPSCVLAQALRYVDEAGNIRFAEGLKQVPRQYREQIVPPTPTPVLDKRALQEKKRLEMEAMRRREMEEQRKKREAVQREMAARKQQERETRRLREEERAAGFSKNDL